MRSHKRLNRHLQRVKLTLTCLPEGSNFDLLQPFYCTEALDALTNAAPSGQMREIEALVYRF
jgi:hypothetical protein